MLADPVGIPRIVRVIGSRDNPHYAKIALFEVLLLLAKSGPSGPGSLRAPRLLRPFGPGHVLGFGPSPSEFCGRGIIWGTKISPMPRPVSKHLKYSPKTRIFDSGGVAWDGIQISPMPRPSG